MGLSSQLFSVFKINIISNTLFNNEIRPDLHCLLFNFHSQGRDFPK